MNLLGRRSLSPIGIDLDGRWLKAVQLSGSSKGWRIAAAASVPRQRHDAAVSPEEVEALLRSLPKHGFVGRDVVVAMPADKVMSAILDLPPCSSGAPVDQIARSELARMHQCDIHAMEMASWELPAPARAGNTVSTMLCACAYADAEALLKLFERCGHSVTAIDSRSRALARACLPTITDPGGITAIIELGWGQVRLVVMHQSLVAYDRTLEDSGVEDLVRTLVAKTRLDLERAKAFLGEVVMDPEAANSERPKRSRRPATRVQLHFDAIADELGAPLGYIENQYPDAIVGQVLLTGPGASIEGLAPYMTARLDLAVQVVAPTSLAEVPETFSDPIGVESTIATGLALYGTETAAPSVNLIPAPKVLVAQRRRHTKQWIAACIAYVGMLCAVYVGCRIRWGGDNLQGGELAQISASITEHNRKIAAVKNASVALRAKIDANNAVGKQPDWSILLALLAKNLGDDVVLKHCELDLGTGASASAGGAGGDRRKKFVLKISGMGRTQTAVSTFILRLEKTGLFREVKRTKTSLESFMTGRAVAFELACTLGTAREGVQ